VAHTYREAEWFNIGPNNSAMPCTLTARRWKAAETFRVSGSTLVALAISFDASKFSGSDFTGWRGPWAGWNSTEEPRPVTIPAS